MKLYQKIIAGGMILGALAGWDCKNDSANKPLEETIKGTPVSVQVAGTMGLSAMIETEEGKYLLTHIQYPIINLIDAAAVIESEMRDGDSEPVEMTGYREGSRFRIKSVSANGYRVDIK